MSQKTQSFRWHPWSFHSLSSEGCIWRRYFWRVILIFYCLTFAGNTVTIFFSSKDPKLQIPMYFSLSNLSLLDICFTRSCIPQMLVNLGSPRRTVTYHAGASHLYNILWLGPTKCILLFALSVFLCVALCCLLWYIPVIHLKISLQLSGLSWGPGLTQSLIQSSVALTLSFCSHLVWDDIVCEVPARIQLSSADIGFNEVQRSIASIMLLVLP